MQILIPDSWLREYLETDATPKEIQRALSLCGPSVERLHKKDNDYIYDIEVTTNRVDMMSVVGIAFECIAVLPQFGYKAKLKKNPYLKRVTLHTSSKVDYIKTKVDPHLCDRFSAVLIKNVHTGPSPDWLVKRLELVGLRSINTVVDSSNYLMHEFGQPVHTFDYDKIAQSIMILRESKKGEKLTTLDSKSHILPGGDIVIEDGNKRLIDLCGIMGGLNSAVDEKTSNVLLFVQVYEPSHIRKTSMMLAQRTEAAVLFEKGLSIENVMPTIDQGVQLFAQLTGGHPEKTVLDISYKKEKTNVLKLRQPLSSFVSERLGITLSFTEISKILKSLEFVVRSESEVEIPWMRAHDVTIPEDLVEEVARIYGYHNLPSKLMSGKLPTNRPDDQTFFWENKIKSILSHLGYTETYTYSLVGQNQTSPTHSLKLLNPLSENWSFLRDNLIKSHEQVIEENIGRVNELKLFEIANVYLPQVNDLPKEELHLVISETNVDYLKFKGGIKIIGDMMGLEIPDVIGETQIEGVATVRCEIDLSNLIPRAKRSKSYVPISTFTPIIEDLNITPDHHSYTQLIQQIKSISPLIQTINLMDRYGNKLTLRITYHDETRQLSNENVASIREKIMELTSHV